tara:strand:+ start:1366 stop:1566 length:201 start_codon:yes stop_codon:yes gene_type:complete
LKNFNRNTTGHKTTDAWLANQGIWYDSDMIRSVLIGLVVGVAIGFIWGFVVGSPDFSGYVPTGIQG